MKFYSVDFIRKCVFLLKKEYFLLRKGVIIVIKGMKNGIYLVSFNNEFPSVDIYNIAIFAIRNKK